VQFAKGVVLAILHSNLADDADLTLFQDVKTTAPFT